MIALLDLSALPPPNGGHDWLALVVAMYGAVVATGVAVYQFVRDRPGVKLVLIPTNVTYDMLVGSYGGPLRSAKRGTSGPFGSSTTASGRSRFAMAACLVIGAS